MTFAQTIRAYRESVGLTQAELAHKLIVSSQTVNNWETGRVEPWPRRKEALLDQLGKGVMPPEQQIIPSGRSDAWPRSASGACQRRRQPNVCEEIAGEGPANAGRQEIVEKPQIDFRRPPPHN